MCAADSGIFAYPWDFDEDSIDRRLARVASIGLRRVVLAVLYHDGHQLLPNGPVRNRWVEGGHSYVPVGVSLYPAGLAPAKSAGELTVGDIVATARRHGLEVEAWTVSLHRDDLVRKNGAELPLVRNVFGEPDPLHLCPSAPLTKSYLTQHLTDVRKAGFRHVNLEGCHFPQLLHGAHHESFPPLGQRCRWLLSLCFCEYCASAPTDLDIERLRASVAAELGSWLAGEEVIPRSMALDELGEDLRAMVARRMQAVTDLVREATSASGVSVRFLDQAAISGHTFRSGQLDPELGPDAGWQWGIDYRALSASCEAIVALGYFAVLSDLQTRLRRYVELCPRLHAGLRPTPPDTASSDDLADKIAFLEELGLERLDFYSLSYCREADLRLLEKALKR